MVVFRQFPYLVDRYFAGFGISSGFFGIRSGSTFLRKQELFADCLEAQIERQDGVNDERFACSYICILAFTSLPCFVEQTRNVELFRPGCFIRLSKSARHVNSSETKYTPLCRTLAKLRVADKSWETFVVRYQRRLLLQQTLNQLTVCAWYKHAGLSERRCLW